MRELAQAGRRFAAPEAVAVPRPAAPVPREPQALLERADAAFARQDYRQALRFYEQAGPNAAATPQQAIDNWYRIGRAQAKLHRPEDALASYQRSLALIGQADPEVKARAEPVARQALGETLRALGKPQQARAEYQRAFDVYQSSGNETGMAHMQAEIGSTFADQADFSAALLNYQKAQERMAAAGSPDLGQLLVNTSSLLTWLGRYDDAAALQAQATKLCDAQGDATCRASAAHVEGFTRFKLGDFEGAAAASRKAAELFGPRPTVERARALNNLGLSLVALRRPGEGLQQLHAALAILHETGGDAKDMATTIDSIGTAYRAERNFTAAGTWYRDALVRWRTAMHREGERDTLANLGQLASDMRQGDASIFYYKLSINLAQSMRANARQLEAGYQDSLTRRLAPSYEVLSGMLVDRGRLAEAHQVMRMLKEKELFDYLQREGPPGATTAALTGHEQAQRDRYERIEQSVFALGREIDELNAKPSESLTSADKARLAELETLLQQARNELEQFCSDLNRDLAVASAESPRVAANSLVALQDTLRRLGHGAVVLHYIPLADHLSIILTAGSAGAVRGYNVQVSSTELNRMVALLREQISSLDPAVKGTAQALHEWLLPPRLRQDLEGAGARILMVSLEGGLRYLPFAALHDGKQWLAERYAVAMYTDAVTSRLERTPRQHWEVRAFGLTHAVDNFPALTWVRSEIDAIVGSQGMPGHADFDADFTFDSLRDAINQARPPVLHIASHFVFRPGTEDDSFLLLGDGRLPLSKIKVMTFTDLDLLTLSACETAIGGGTNRNGQEIEGFAALVQAQGADAVLATLWPVADISTAAFMQSFYKTRRTEADITKVEALRETQLAMIRGTITAASARADAGLRGTVEGGAGQPASTDFSQPYFWAPFVLIGNWR